MATPTRTYRNRSGELVEITEVSATRAKSFFGEILERVSEVGAVAITRHDRPKAVLISQEEFDSLCRERSQTLDELGDRFDALLARMQEPSAREGMKAAFEASSEELGRAAVEAARRDGEE